MKAYRLFDVPARSGNFLKNALREFAMFSMLVGFFVRYRDVV
jgi:hypothetical protein